MRIRTVVTENLTRRASVLFCVAWLSWSAAETAALDRMITFRAHSNMPQEKEAGIAQPVSETPQEASNDKENESHPEKAPPMKDFVPSEEIEPDKAVDFPADI
jgi:hypothetical protein